MDRRDVSLRAYRTLLRVYAPDFRREAEVEMAAVFDEALRAARADGRGYAMARLWVRTVLDVAFSATSDRYARRRHRHRGKGTSDMDSILQDIRYALRSLGKSAGFTAVAALTTAIGIGATATIFSVANAVMLRSLPGVRDVDELVSVHATSPNGSSFHSVSIPNYVDLREGDTGLSDLAAFTLVPTSLSGPEKAEVTAGLLVSANYFATLRTNAALGRLLSTVDGRELDADATVVVSHSAWSRRFEADPDVIGSTLSLNGHPFTVVGVTEPGFRGHLAILDVEVFIPLGAQPLLQVQDGRFTDRNWDWLELVGRRAGDVSLAQASAALSRVGDRLEADFPSQNAGQGIDIRPYSNLFAQQADLVSRFFLLLFVVSGVILLVAAVNVGGMLLARGADRRGEMALRLALGAGRGRLVRQMITESTILFLLGGGGGIVIAYSATALLSAVQLPIPVPVVFDFTPDRRVLLFAAGLAFVTGVGFGLMPALRATRHRLAEAISSGRLSGRSRLREAFVVTQVAASALLLIGAGLFVRALASAGAVDLGFDPTGVQLLSLDLGVQQYEEAAGLQFFENLVRDANATRQVETAALVQMPPLAFGNSTTVVSVPGSGGPDGDGEHPTDVNRVTGGYFRTLRIPFAAGREFRDDEMNSIVINETLAARLWPGESPLGRGLRLGTSGDLPLLTVVGVARDGKYRSLTDGPRAMLYLPLDEFYAAEASLIARPHGSEQLTGDVLGDLVRRADPQLPITQNVPMVEVVGLSVLPNRVAAVTAGAFGIIGLLLSAIGLYGILAYAVARRTREIGLRAALGAPRGSLGRLVLGDGVRLVAIGTAIGFGAAMGLTRFLGSLLHGVSPTDPVTFAAIGALLTIIAAFACLAPTLRATRTDPMEALRHD